VIKLEQNYRSTNVILQAANAVIKNNQQRHPKYLWSQQESGPLIEIFHTATEAEEAEHIAHRIAMLKQQRGLRWSQIAILYRSNALSRHIELALMKYSWRRDDHWIRGIPYQIFGGQEFYERREVKDLVAYLRVIQNPLDQEAILRTINLPRRGIGETSLDHLTAYQRQHSISLWDLLCAVKEGRGPEVLSIPDKARQGIAQWCTLIEEARRRFATPPLHETLQWLIETTNYKKAIQEEVQSEKMRDFKWENVEEFISALADYEEAATAEATIPILQEFLSNALLNISPHAGKQNKKYSDDRVTMMTFHSAKGLEFTACFLVGMEDHIIPHEKSLKETGIEEERRLMYVALTRAKQYLACSMSRTRKRMGKIQASSPSRFLYEIPRELRKHG
jgi:superfamily I DNA/RNA helicase